MPENPIDGGGGETTEGQKPDRSYHTTGLLKSI